MKTYVKNFIGKSKSVQGLQIVKVTCKLEDFQKFSRFFDGIQYVTFDVAAMKQPDNFGRDYTVYVTLDEEQMAAIEKKEARNAAYQSPSVPKEEKEPVSGDDLPF